VGAIARAAVVWREVPVFYATWRPTYEGGINKQLEDAKAKTGPGDLKKLLSSGDTWRVN
jgi:2-oxoglutarate ferredoxin oxidoreductase subunit beta